ncbi:MAG: AMP-binding protein [Clostridia bacterium]|nr:AMP-binding protein [Clostridia bacterium]
MGRAIDTDTSMYGYVLEGLKDVPDKTVFYFKGNKILKSRFLKDVDKFCSILIDFGVERGSVVAVHLPNIPDAAIAFYAINKLGAIANLIHPLMPAVTLSDMVREADAKLVITFDGYYSRNAEKLDITCPVMICRASDYLPPLKALLYSRSEPKIEYGGKLVSYRALMSRAQPYGGAMCSRGEDCAAYMHSGGTTGTPKTIALSNRSFNELTESLIHVIPDYDCFKDVSLMVLPIFHGFGLGVCLHSMLSRGVESVMIPRYRTAEVLKAIGSRKVTITAGVPLMYKKMLGGGKLFKNMSGVRHMFCGGDKLTSVLKGEFDSALSAVGNPNRLLEGYGLTECVTVCCVNKAEDYIKGCLGYPLHGIKIAVLGEDLEFLPAGEVGEIAVSGPTLMIGYTNADMSDIFFMREGVKWLRTGDVGYIDGMGRLYYNGRLKAAEKVCGVVVYPQEITEVVGDLPFVIESCAVKICDNDKEYMRLYCSVDGDEEECRRAIAKHCEDKLIVYARPKEIVFVSSLPRTPVGKVDVGKLGGTRGTA